MKVKTNYDLGDKVWFMDQNRPQCGNVTYVYINVSDCERYSVCYLVRHESKKRAEDTLFRTKQELLNTL